MGPMGKHPRVANAVRNLEPRWCLKTWHSKSFNAISKAIALLPQYRAKLGDAHHLPPQSRAFPLSPSRERLPVPSRKLLQSHNYFGLRLVLPPQCGACSGVLQQCDAHVEQALQVGPWVRRSCTARCTTHP